MIFSPINDNDLIFKVILEMRLRKIIILRRAFCFIRHITVKNWKDEDDIKKFIPKLLKLAVDILQFPEETSIGCGD